jgi:hypothetical protein
MSPGTTTRSAASTREGTPTRNQAPAAALFHLLRSRRGRTPIARWLQEDKLRYIDNEKSPTFGGTSWLQLPRVLRQKPGSKVKIATERNLVNCRDAQASGGKGGARFALAEEGDSDPSPLGDDGGWTASPEDALQGVKEWARDKALPAPTPSPPLLRSNPLNRNQPTATHGAREPITPPLGGGPNPRMR